MKLEIRDRASQSRERGAEKRAKALSDDRYDGVEIPVAAAAHYWLREQRIHGTVLLSSEVDSTRNFLGPQVNMLRDDVRLKTWAAYIESGRLVLAEVAGREINRRVLATHDVWRSHLTLDKHTGSIMACWVTRGPRSALWFQGKEVRTATRQPDFPFFALSQAPIGHIQAEAAPYGLLAYKCRETGTLFLRKYQGGEFSAERPLKAPATLGGISFAVSGNSVLARIDAIDGDRVRPMIARSNDEGASFESFQAIPLPNGNVRGTFFTGPPVADHGGYFHVPAGTFKGDEVVALDVLVDKAIVEAISVPSLRTHEGTIVVAASPKKPVEQPQQLVPQQVMARFGNGVTDGIGIIAILANDGRLFSSNSQAGGFHYPEAIHLNHEMPSIAAFGYTECYTSGARPNHVSMDYVYLEGCIDGRPVSRGLHLETWDMPLPYPRLKARAEGASVYVTIEADANFEPGKTTFAFEDPGVAIKRVEISGDRTAVVIAERPDLRGKRLWFGMRSLFYHHEAVVTVE